VSPDPVRYQVVTQIPTEEVVDLYQEGGWWREDASWRSAIPGMVKGSFCFMVARDREGRALGMARAISDGFSDAYVQDVVVRRSARGQGIGRELVRRVTGYCVDKGISWIGLVAEPGSQAFYEALGYRAMQGHQPMLFGGEGIP
jgi:ribosomal protein S18 acetylase RimI-like enzyme